MEVGSGEREAGGREPIGGILLLVLFAMAIAGLSIHHVTLELGWDKLPHFFSVIVGASLVDILAERFHRYMKAMLTVYAVAAIIFIVGLRVWINI